MSKKLIAVAAAAALALSALVAMPSVAAVGPFAVTVTGQETTNQVNRNGATATLPLQIMVPSNDVIRSVATLSDADTSELPAGSSTALRLAIVTPGATDAITITSTGGVKVLTDTQFAATTTTTTATGVQSLTVPAANGDAVIYVYTTSTTAGTVVISAAGSSRTLYVQGISTVANNIYKLAFTASASAAIGGTISVTGTVRDMFDNLLTPTAANLTVKTLGGNLTGADVAPTDFLVNATTKVVTFTVPSTTTATTLAVSIVAVTPATAVTAFPGRVVSQFATVSVQDQAAQVTALTAQVASLQAQLAALQIIKDRKVSKLKYNRLARKWNAAFPSNKVWVKP
jgi:hypothetical protein